MHGKIIELFSWYKINAASLQCRTLRRYALRMLRAKGSFARKEYAEPRIFYNLYIIVR